MTPAALRLHLAQLPWDDYTPAELNEIQIIFTQAIGETRTLKTRYRRAHLQRQMAERPMLTPEQIAAQTTGAQIYPAGSRHE